MQLTRKLIIFKILALFWTEASCQSEIQVTLSDILQYGGNAVDTSDGSLILPDELYKMTTDSLKFDQSHWEGVEIYGFSKSSDGYIQSMTTQEYLIESVSQDWEYYHYYEQIYRTKEKKYLFSKLRNAKLDSTSPYKLLEINPGSFRLSQIFIKGVQMQLTKCFQEQRLDFLPDGHVVMFYGNRYDQECTEPLDSLHIDLYSIATQTDSITLSAFGTRQMVATKDYLFILSTAVDAPQMLTLARKEDEFSLVDSAGNKFVYEKID